MNKGLLDYIEWIHVYYGVPYFMDESRCRESVHSVLNKVEMAQVIG